MMQFVSLTHTMEDGQGYDWDVRGDGSIGDGENDAFDTAFDWYGMGFTNAATVSDYGTELTLIPYVSAYYQRLFERRIYVSDTAPWVRYVDTVTNMSDQTVTYDYRIEFDFGQDGFTRFGTSSGDDTLEDTDTWLNFYSSSATATNTESGVLFGDGTLLPDLSFSYDDLDIVYSVTLAPGASASFLSFGVQGDDSAAITALLEALSTPSYDALDGLDGDALDRIVNWSFREHGIVHTGTDANETLNGASLDDTVSGNGGNDKIFGLGGSDVLSGGYGDDVLLGGDGDDTLFGDDAGPLITVSDSAVLADGRSIGINLTMPDASAEADVLISGFVSRWPVENDLQELVFAIDVSASVLSQFQGSGTVGDLNNDGLSGTVLDAEIAAFDSILDQLIDAAGLQETVITIVEFSSEASVLFSGTAARDSNGDGVWDAREAVRELQISSGTRYDTALQAVVDHLTQQTPGPRALYVLSDGDNNSGGSVLEEVADLDALGVVTQSFAMGTGAPHVDLDLVDDGVANGSVTTVSDPATVGQTQLEPGVAAGDIASLDVLVNGALQQSIAGQDLIVTPFGLHFDEVSVGGLTLGASDTVALRLVASDPNATTLSVSQQLETNNQLDGDDFLRGGAGSDSLKGGSGNDTLAGGKGADTLDGGEGFDAISFWDAGAGLRVDLEDSGLNTGDARGDIFRNFEELRGSQYDDLLFGRSTADQIMGLLGRDELHGRAGHDTLYGNGGDDLIYGDTGNDVIDGGYGADTLYAGIGHDTVTGGFGRDVVYLEDGADRFEDSDQGGFDGQDTVWGGGGHDTIIGRGGADLIYGEVGNDYIAGGAGNDTIEGGDQRDTIYGGDGADSVTSGNGGDRVFLGNGDDWYADNAQVQYGHDEVYGGNGDDHLFLDGGNDTVEGGPGADTFVFGWVLGHDRILDYEIDTDRIELNSRHWHVPQTQFQLDRMSDTSSGDLVLSFDSGMSLTLVGLTSNAGLLDDITLF